MIKIMETFAFRFCTLWVLLGMEETSAGRLETERTKEDWMKRIIFLATVVALVAMLALAPMALAQGTTVMTGSPSAHVPKSGGPAILLPAAALLLGSGILTYAILRRR
jgi:hypothetical protein